ncbi:MAG: non-canonical purine NTP pyrophosphatase [bacterium]|nr:non-canonical purine NTP pyrophosphatase [bacterium]
MDILIATKNKFKASEMIWYLEGLPDVVTHHIEELKDLVRVEEDGKTLLENAEKKAREISLITDWYVLASDRGVDIPGLGEKWDVLRNQRIVGEGKTDKEKVTTLMEMMAELEGEERRTEDHFALVLAKNGQVIWSGEEIVDRGFVAEEIGKEDIPLDTWMGFVWFYPQYGRRYTELSKEEMDEIKKQQESLKKKLQESIKEILEIEGCFGQIKVPLEKV